MSGPINRLPLGLLGLFDLKTLGRYPTELGETILPTVDVAPFLFAQPSQYLGMGIVGGISTQGFVSMNQYPATVVPITEYWLVTAATLRGNALVTEKIRHQLVAAIPGNTVAGQAIYQPITTEAVSNLSSAPATGSGSAIGFLKGPVLLGPGSEIMHCCFEITTAATIVISAGIRYLRLAA